MPVPAPAPAAASEGFAGGGFELANTLPNPPGGAAYFAQGWLAAPTGFPAMLSSDAHSGSRSALLTVPGGFGGSTLLQNSVDHGGLPMLTSANVGQTPVLSFWAKGSAGGTGNVLFALRYLDANGTILSLNGGNHFFQDQINTTTWTKISFQASAIPAGAKAVFLEMTTAVGPVGVGPAGEQWGENAVKIDDINLDLAAAAGSVAAPAPAPTPAPAPAPAPSPAPGSALQISFSESTPPVLGGFAGAEVSLVADPENAANQVARFVRAADALAYAGATVATLPNAMVPPIGFSASKRTMSVRVWTPNANVAVRLKVENVDDPALYVETETIATMAGWQTLVFNFASPVTGSPALNLAAAYKRVVIFFDFGKTGAQAGLKTYYFDDLSFVP